MGKSQSKKIQEKEQSFCGLVNQNADKSSKQREVQAIINEFFSKSQEYICLQNLVDFSSYIVFGCYSYKKMKIVAVYFEQILGEGEIENDKQKTKFEEVCKGYVEKAQFQGCFESTILRKCYDIYEIEIDAVFKQLNMEDLQSEDSSSIKNLFIEEKQQKNDFDLKSVCNKKIDLFQLGINFGNNQRGTIQLSNLNQFLLQQQSIISFSFKQQGFNLTKTTLQQLLNILNKNTDLKCIDIELKYSQIDSSTLRQLTEAIQKCRKLLVLKLDLALNNICKSGINKSSQFFGMCSQLQSLSLSFKSNRILSEGMQLISQNMQKLVNLRDLYLDFRQIEINISYYKKQIKLKSKSECGIINGVEKIGLSLQNCKQISHLKLCFRYNKLRSEDCVILMKYINNIESIISLSLDYQDCQLNSQDVIHFVKLIKNQKELTELDLNLKQNNIECDTAQAIINELSALKNLKSLSLDIKQNQILSSTLEKIRRTAKFQSLIKMSFGIKQNDCHQNVLNKFYSAIKKNIRLVNFQVIN